MSLFHFTCAFLVAAGLGAFGLWMMGPLLNAMGSFEGEDL